MSGALSWFFGLPVGDLPEADGWALRFMSGALRPPWALPKLAGALFVLGVLAWLVVRTYAKEGRGTPRLRRLLAGLRVGLLVLGLIVFLQPAVVLRYDRSAPSVVALLVDDTLSMRWADRYAPGEDLAALASFLGVSDGALAGAERLTRLEVVRAALRRPAAGLERLSRKHEIFLMRFGGAESYTETLARVDATRRGAGASPAKTGQTLAEALDRLKGDGHETNLGMALRGALDRLEGRRLAAVVLISDGQNTGEAAREERARAVTALLSERGVPLHAVAVGDPTPPRNVLLAQLTGPGEARKGSTLQLSAFVVSRRYAGVAVEVRLSRARAGTANWEDAGRTAVTLAGGEGPDEGSLQEVRLEHAADETGDFVYRARIEPLEDELVRTDNEATAAVRVSDRKVAVLLVGGSSAWEFQYLRNFILRDPDRYALTVLQQNADPDFNQDASPGMKRRTLPKTREELFAYDAVILYDPIPDAAGCDAEFLGLLADFVGGHHGGLCYIAGHKYTAEALGEGGPLAKLRELLPVVLKDARTHLFAGASGSSGAQAPGGGPGPSRAAWRAALTPAGLDHPVTRLGASDEEARDLWGHLPGVYRSVPVLRVKSLATALVTHGDPARQTIDGEQEPLIAVQYYGRGRCVFFSFDSTWRWRKPADLAHYGRFWANVLDFLSAGRLQKKRVVITTGGDVFDVGAAVRVHAEAYRRDFTPMEGATFTVESVHLETKEAGTHELACRREGYFEGTMRPSRTGTYEIRPKSDAEGMADWTEEDVATRQIAVRLPEDEFRRPEANFAALRELAGAPARFRRVHELGGLADAIPDARSPVILEEPHALWNTPFCLMLFAALLIVEWTIRKTVHMM